MKLKNSDWNCRRPIINIIYYFFRNDEALKLFQGLFVKYRRQASGI